MEGFFSCQAVVLNFTCAQGALNNPIAQPAPQINSVRLSSTFPSLLSLNVLFMLSLFFFLTNFLVFRLLLVAEAVGMSPWHSPPSLLPKAVYCKYLWGFAQGLFSSQWHLSCLSAGQTESDEGQFPWKRLVGPWAQIGVPPRLFYTLSKGSEDQVQMPTVVTG